MARVNIEDETRADPRFIILGKKIGTTKQDALGRMIAIWSFCTDKQTHHLSGTMIDTLAEYEGFSKLLADPDVNLAAQDFPDGMFYIRGTYGRIEWLAKLRENGAKGGRPITKGKPDANQMVNQNVTRREPDANPPSLVPSLAPSLSLNTNTRRKAPPPLAAEFEILYKRYPKKMGKQGGMKIAARDIKTPEDLEALARAIDNFKEVHATKKTAPEYLPYFSTFMSSWRDCLDPDYGQTSTGGQMEKRADILELERQMAEEKRKAALKSG